MTRPTASASASASGTRYSGAAVATPAANALLGGAAMIAVGGVLAAL